MGTQLPLPQKGTDPQFSARLLWPNGWLDQDGTWRGGGPRYRPHCARWGPSSPPQKGDITPIFGPCLLWPNGWMDQDATWYGDRPRPRPHCARWRPDKKGQSPQFSAHVYCGQTAEWIKMPLGTEVGLGPGDIIGTKLPSPQKGDRAPNFGPCLLWPSGWMDQDASWYGDRPRPRTHCVRWGPISPTKKGAEPPPFSAHV